MTLFRCKQLKVMEVTGFKTRAIGFFTVTVEKVVSFKAKTIVQLCTSNVVTGPRGRTWPLWQSLVDVTLRRLHRSKEYARHLIVQNNVEK